MRALLVSILVLGISSLGTAKDEISQDELVQRHLASIGDDKARAMVKSRVAEGSLRFQMQHQGGTQDGKEVLVAEGNKMVSLLNFPNPALPWRTLYQRRAAHHGGHDEARGLFGNGRIYQGTS